MVKSRILVVDDDEAVRISVSKILVLHDFAVVQAPNVPEALHCIKTAAFDVLLTDLRMPGPGDGLTVVAAMRRAHPGAITFLMTAVPEVAAAGASPQPQADLIIAKPMNVPALIKTIKERLSEKPVARVAESAAVIVDRSVPVTVEDWITRVEQEEKLT